MLLNFRRKLTGGIVHFRINFSGASKTKMTKLSHKSVFVAAQNEQSMAAPTVDLAQH